MKTYRSMKEELLNTESEMKQYQQGISRDIEKIGEYADVSKLWEKGVAWAKETFSKRQTLLIVGGAVVGFMVVSYLVGGRRRRVVEVSPNTGNGGQVVVQREEEPSMLGALINMAVKTFVLALARKLLLEAMKRMEKNADKTDAKADGGYAAGGYRTTAKQPANN
jgi:hypothetical protein